MCQLYEQIFILLQNKTESSSRAEEKTGRNMFAKDMYKNKQWIFFFSLKILTQTFFVFVQFNLQILRKTSWGDSQIKIISLSKS